MKEAEHLAGALDQAELRAFYDRLAPNSQGSALTPHRDIICGLLLTLRN